MKIVQPLKMKSTGRVIGYFYRLCDDGKLQYVSFGSSVDSIQADKVESASRVELEAAKQQQREAGLRGCACGAVPVNCFFVSFLGPVGLGALAAISARVRQRGQFARRLFAVVGLVMFAQFSHIGFCGSRSLPVPARPLVSSVVSAVLSGSPARVAVGCSVGADSLVLSSVPSSALSRVSVFAAFGPGGRGGCSLSAVSAVLSAARGGASVRWWSGGQLAVALKLRLARRSVALVRFLSLHRPSALVCFLSSPKSRGSLLACRLAARLGVTVFVFCVGFSPSRLRRLALGSWVLVQLGGHTVLQWQPSPTAVKLRRLYDSITSTEYDARYRKSFRQLRAELKDAITVGLVIATIIFGTLVYLLHPNPAPHKPPAQNLAQVELPPTEYEPFLLPFDDEKESRACLEWLNNSSVSMLDKALSRQKVSTNRVDTLVSHRPYKSWNDVNALQKIGIRTLEQIVRAWRESQ